MFIPARPAAHILTVTAAILFVAACGPSQQQAGFQGFPAVGSHDLGRHAEIGPRQLRIRGADGGLQGGRGPRPGDGDSRTEAVPGRLRRPRRASAVRDRSEAARRAGRGTRSRPGACAGAEGAIRSRGGAPEATGGEAGGRTEGSRRRRLQRRTGRRRGQGCAGQAGRSETEPRVTRASRRRSPACRAVHRSPKAAWSPRTTRCSPRSRNPTRSGFPSPFRRTSSWRSTRRSARDGSRCPRTMRMT